MSETNFIQMTGCVDDSLRTRIANTLYQELSIELPAAIRGADAVIREIGSIPDRTHTDEHGRTWEWCGGQPGTWAWRITAVEVDVKCAVCKRTYGVRADAPGWSAVWTCCISCQANEENEWLKRDKK